ncbi:hypothetical protein ACHAQA_002528 [Verticillium albo-atrum]
MSSPTALLRLTGLTASQLPAPDAPPDALSPFLRSLLEPAIPFIDSVAPRAGGPATGWTPKGTKRFKGSAAGVETSSRVVDGGDTWACRRSVHADAATRGTASWGEFVGSFLERHRESERAFTPGVVDSREGGRWAGARGVEVDVGGEAWTCEVLIVQEMRHAMPGGLLRDRVFGTVMVGAVARGRDEFVVVSVPVRDLERSAMGALVKEKGVVVGAYVSVERIRKTETGEIEWIMATASDAKGVLPLWVQTKAVVGVVAKDVELFLSWIAERRDKGEVAEWTSHR